MKILFVITSLGVGGAERQVVDLSDRLAAAGHTVAIAYLAGKPELRPADAGILLIGMEISRSLAGFITAYTQIRRLIQSFQPDVVHSHMVHANLITRMVRLTTRMRRLICTAHSTDEGGRLRMWAYRLTDRLADLSTNVSAEAVTAFVNKGAAPPGRMIAVENGIDTKLYGGGSDESARDVFRRSHGLMPSHRLILAIGRLEEAKDYPNLLNAFSHVRRMNGDAFLWIAGDGKLMPALRRLASDLGIAECVRFLGVRPDVPMLLNACDVFALSSAWEGFGLVVAEAMASERVVVATDCGGVRELLGGCGYFVPPRDPLALAAALGRALELHHEEASTMGARARQRVVSHYSIEKAVATWIGIYADASSPARA